jgi:Na+/H+-dicarboxylate symporter
MNYLNMLPVQLLLSILVAFILGYLLDVFYISLFFSISSCFIEILIFLLPLMVFSFIFRALVNSKRNSLSLLLLIFAGVTLSNCLALTTAYFFGQSFLPFLCLSHSPDFMAKFNSQVPLLFTFKLPALIETEKALAFGIIAGVIVSFLNEENPIKKFSQKSSMHLSYAIILFLQKIFMPLLPLYVFGFCLKLSYDKALVHLFQQFGKVFLLSMTLVGGYIYLLYFFGSGRDFKKTQCNFKAMLPAGLTGFSTMSSAATLPVTLMCTEKTTKDRHFTDLIIPSTANIHMLGDDLTIVITAMTLLSIFGLPWPDLNILIPFVLAFSLAKLSCVGVPGASILVILPVLQKYLGFTPEMISVLTTIYILQDGFGTAANVMGNGAFALIIQRIFQQR